MKNINIIPTDKPSRLLYFGTSKELTLQVNPATFRVFERSTQNIYITSDEEIKEGDWVLNIEENTILKPSNDEIYDIENSEAKYYEFIKKIILTTDQSLDGIQAIDDEFLEWFIKNPSCEEVGVNKIYNDYGETDIFDLVCTLHSFKYKIIIPKEEICSFCDGTGQVVSSTTISRFKTCDCKILPKEELSTKLHIGEVVDESYPKEFKQETLEEAAIINCESITHPYCDREKAMFIKGAKWQQERSYSEEEMIDLIQFLSMNEEFNGYGSVSEKTAKHFLEQFKKK